LRLGEGAVIGGRLATVIDPRISEALAAGRPSVLVTGTNGKTTTTALVAAGVGRVGRVTSNATGANLAAGIVGALISSPTSGPLVLEVDEAVLGWALNAVDPGVVILLNLSRDQLDRHHEVRRSASSWRRWLTAAPGVTVVANADDPLVCWAAEPVRHVWVSLGQPWKHDAGICPGCEGTVVMEDEWRCLGCGRHRPAPLIELVDGEAFWPATGRRLTLDLGLPGRCNRADAVAALAAAACLGIDPEDALASWANTEAVAGRYAMPSFHGKELRLLLAKNPASWLETVGLLDNSTSPVVIALNARGQDGRDVSWIWDVPFEQLRGRLVICTGERAWDLAVRLRYADVRHVVQPELAEALLWSPHPHVDVMANYSAFQAIRSLVGHAA